ncbi:MAG TPA: ferritin-like domain-containing protein [Acidimicrobiia bacterium]|nr:ferritin-like domain-containing protein [Acidimicrobiia bacterium]
MDLTDSSAWLGHFEGNRRHRPEPDWHRPTPFPAPAAAALARSLAHFQLGESGEGATLMSEARRAWPDDPDYVAALALFVAEEQEHARLLEHLVARLGGTLVTRHWTHRCFRTLRRALGAGFEIQTLVIAEIIGTAYYRLLRSTGDAVLRQVCELMLRDEIPHLRFHADRLVVSQLRWRAGRRTLWAAQFRVLFRAAVTAAWIDHRSALLALGIDRRLFTGEARAEARDWLLRRRALGRSPLPPRYQAGGAIPSRSNRKA